jgi:hypothetical protein
VRYTTEDFSFGVGYNVRKILPAWDTTEENLCFIGYNRKKSSNFMTLFCGVSHTGRKPLTLSPTPEKNLFRCIPQRRKPLAIVSHTGIKNW